MGTEPHPRQINLENYRGEDQKGVEKEGLGEGMVQKKVYGKKVQEIVS